MRSIHQALAISAAVHVAAMAWGLSREAPPAPPPAPRTPTPIEIVPVTPPAPAPPIDVAIVDLDALPPPPPPPAASAPAPRTTAPARGTVAIDTGRAIGGAPGPREPGGEPPPAGPRTSLLGMRNGRSRVDLALPPGYRDDLDRAPAGTAPARDVDPTGALSPSGGGTYKSNQGVFSAKIAADGTVDLKDARNLRLNLALPTPKSVGRGIADWYQSDMGRGGDEGDAALAKNVKGSLDSGVAHKPEDKGDRSKTAVVPVVGGGFDVTDWLMRRKKHDPYAAQKLAFLDATRDERVQLGKRYRDQQLQQTARIVRKNLERLWRATPDPAARKRALFELWDEIADPPADDPVLAEATDAARTQVIGFIRARLPAGSAHAYTPAEIAALARGKQSKATFAPYD